MIKATKIKKVTESERNRESNKRRGFKKITMIYIAKKTMTDVVRSFNSFLSTNGINPIDIYC